MNDVLGFAGELALLVLCVPVLTWALYLAVLSVLSFPPKPPLAPSPPSLRFDFEELSQTPGIVRTQRFRLSSNGGRIASARTLRICLAGASSVGTVPSTRSGVQGTRLSH